MTCPGASPRPAGTSAFLAKPSTNGEPGTRVTVRPAYAIDRESRSTPPGQRLARWSPKSCTCGSVIDFGPGRIASYLHRFHHLTVARSTVHRILIRYGMNRLPANQKRRPTGRPWHRYEKPQPGHRLQLDVKFLERIAGSQKAPLSVHRHRRLHAHSGAQDLRCLQPKVSHQLRGRGHPPAPL